MNPEDSIETVDGYACPLDPADAFNCESCQ